MISKLKEAEKGEQDSLNVTKDKMLIEQLEFLKARISQITQELEEKERVIQTIEAEKSEYAKRFDTLEFLNLELQEKNKRLQDENLEYSKSLEKADELIKTLEEKLGKYSGKKSIVGDENKDELEADGIKLLSLDQSGELYRASLGPPSEQNEQKLLDDSIALWNELDRVKKEKARAELKKKEFENEILEQKFVMQEEISQLKEESILKTEHLERQERTTRQINQEVSLIFYLSRWLSTRIKTTSLLRNWMTMRK